MKFFYWVVSFLVTNDNSDFIKFYRKTDFRYLKLFFNNYKYLKTKQLEKVCNEFYYNYKTFTYFYFYVIMPNKLKIIFLLD